MKRNWANDPICKLCGVEPETPTHLCKDCPFSKHVWSYVKKWLNLSILDSMGMTGSLHGYWRKCRVKFDRRQRKRIYGILIYFCWNISKERNRRTFQQKSLQPIIVALLCRDEIQYKWQQDQSLEMFSKMRCLRSVLVFLFLLDQLSSVLCHDLCAKIAGSMISV
jgi:hypothetical protein